MKSVTPMGTVIPFLNCTHLFITKRNRKPPRDKNGRHVTVPENAVQYLRVIIIIRKTLSADNIQCRPTG